MLKINAGSYSFEAANPRHEHEYHLFERVKVPDGKVLCPGMITHASNIVEHPELIAERIMRFAKLVGRENVMAGGGLRLLVPGAVPDRSPPHRGLGEVQGDAAGRRYRQQAAVGQGCCMTATPPIDRETLRRKTAPLLLCERARTAPAPWLFGPSTSASIASARWRDYAALVARTAQALRSARRRRAVIASPSWATPARSG